MVQKLSIDAYAATYEPPRTRNAVYQAIRRGLIPATEIRREGRRIFILVPVEPKPDAHRGDR